MTTQRDEAARAYASERFRDGSPDFNDDVRCFKAGWEARQAEIDSKDARIKELEESPLCLRKLVDLQAKAKRLEQAEELLERAHNELCSGLAEDEFKWTSDYAAYKAKECK